MKKKRYKLKWKRIIVAIIILILVIVNVIQIISHFSKNRTNNEQTTTVNYQLEEKNAKNTEKSEKEAMLRFCSLSVVNCEVENQ